MNLLFTCPQNMTTDSLVTSNDSHLLYTLFYRREEIIDIIKQRFVEKNNVNLQIFGIDAPNLKDFTTTEKDMKKGNHLCL